MKLGASAGYDDVKVGRRSDEMTWLGAAVKRWILNWDLDVKDNQLCFIDSDRAAGMMLSQSQAAALWPKIKSFSETGDVNKSGADIEAIRLSIANNVRMTSAEDGSFIFHPGVHTDEDLTLSIYISNCVGGRYRVSDKMYSALEWGVYRHSDLDDFSGLVLPGKRPLKRRLKQFLEFADFAADDFAVQVDGSTGEVFDEFVVYEYLAESVEDVTSCMLHLRSAAKRRGILR